MAESLESSMKPETELETNQSPPNVMVIDQAPQDPIIENLQPPEEGEAEKNTRLHESSIIKFMERSKEVPKKYKTTHPKRGKCVIVNFYKTHYRSKMPPRYGSEHDVRNLEEIFRLLDFDVETWNKEEIKLNWFLSEIKKVANYDCHSDSDCFVMIIMCHGEDGGKLRAYDETFKPRDVWENFTAGKCPGLAGKPKLFFFQACRGDKMTKEAHAHAHGKKCKEKSDKEVKYSIPVEADILLGFSTFEDKVSFRDPDEGSPFILSLCGVLKHDKEKPDEEKENIHNLMTYVAKSVAAYTYKCGDDETGFIVKQLPTFTSTLLRLFYLVNK